MIEITQSQIARSVDVLKNGPMVAKVFAEKMWPGRHKDPGKASKAGHAILHRLGTFGYVEKTGDMWFLRSSSGSTLGATWAVPMVGPTVQPLAGPMVGPPAEPSVQPSVVSPVAPPVESPDEQLARQRLVQLVQLADGLVPSVTHDVALGNLRIRDLLVDACVEEACAFAVLRGRSLNVYLPVGPMLVALQPAEGARALYVRWRQSGLAPEPPYRGGACWFLMDDGICAAPGSWKPQGAGRDWRMLEEPFLERVARQRAAAGLGPPVQNGGRR
jgi:hypothetical protein